MIEKLQFIYDILVNEDIIPDNHLSSYTVPCPFHGEEEGNSLGINFNKGDSGVFKCFSAKCDGKGIKGNLYRLINLLGYGNYSQKRDIVKEPFQLNRNIFEEEEQTDLIEFDLRPFQKYHSTNLSYLESRGIESQILESNQCSFSSYYQRIYIPAWMNQKCYGYVGRSVLTDNYKEACINHIMKMEQVSYEESRKGLIKGTYETLLNSEGKTKYPRLKRYKPFRKYTNMYGLDKDNIVFEPLTNSSYNKHSIVVEGMVNAFMANQFGVNAYAILGSYPNITQVNYILEKSEGTVLLTGFDNDKAGENNTKIFNQLAKRRLAGLDWNTLDRYVNDLNDGLTEQEFNGMILNRSYVKQCYSF